MGKFTVGCLLGASIALSVHAQDFKAYKLQGEWTFTNTRTGVNYGGPIEVQVNSIDAKGVMKGQISYDGRQTNDKCTTKALFNDVPVDVEVIKSGTEYRLAYRLNCSVSPSPRDFSMTLSCNAEGVCSQPTERPWGKGLISLREVR